MSQTLGGGGSLFALRLRIYWKDFMFATTASAFALNKPTMSIQHYYSEGKRSHFLGSGVACMGFGDILSRIFHILALVIWCYLSRYTMVVHLLSDKARHGLLCIMTVTEHALHGILIKCCCMCLLMESSINTSFLIVHVRFFNSLVAFCFCLNVYACVLPFVLNFFYCLTFF